MEGEGVEAIWERANDQHTNEKILCLANCLKNANECIIACHFISTYKRIDENKEKRVFLVARTHWRIWRNAIDRIANCTFLRYYQERFIQIQTYIYLLIY